jgi:predicted ABC-type ATPase
MTSPLDRRPLFVAIAGPNGAGKTTFYNAHLRPAGLRFVNADLIAQELRIGAYEAAELANAIREELIHQRESFVFETVLSDPVGDKVDFLLSAKERGYTVVLIFIGTSGADISETRVAMRVSQGGHDVPPDKLVTRYPRTMANLKRAIHSLPYVWIYDNDDLADPYRLAARYENGKLVEAPMNTPAWLKTALQ